MIVLCNGVFDPFHVGHLYHLQAAAKMGTLYVSVTQDAFVNKGPGRPVFNERQRIDMVESLGIVESAFLCKSALDALQWSEPDVFVKGIEYKGKILPEDETYCFAHNIKIVFTDTPRWSSTDLLHYYDRLRQG